MVVAFIGVGVNTFYPSPTETYQKQQQELPAQMEALNIKNPGGSSVDATTQAQLAALQMQQNALQDKIDAADEGVGAQHEHHPRPVRHAGHGHLADAQRAASRDLERPAARRAVHDALRRGLGHLLGQLGRPLRRDPLRARRRARVWATSSSCAAERAAARSRGRSRCRVPAGVIATPTSPAWPLESRRSRTRAAAAAAALGGEPRA